MDILFVMIIGFYSYQFIQCLIKMRKNIILPATNEEVVSVRKSPQKVVNFPTYSKQKTGIIIYSIFLIFIIALFIIGKITGTIDWSFFPLLYIPLLNSNNLINLFAVTGDGILDGNRLIRWNKIKSFQFIPININHKFYGYSQEVNDAYELIIKTKGFPISCIVTSSEMKEKLNTMLSERVSAEIKQAQAVKEQGR